VVLVGILREVGQAPQMYGRLMGEFPKGGVGPLPSEGRTWLEAAHQKDLREEHEHDAEVKEALAAKHRRWWPFGKRREKKP